VVGAKKNAWEFDYSAFQESPATTGYSLRHFSFLFPTLNDRRERLIRYLIPSVGVTELIGILPQGPLDSGDIQPTLLLGIDNGNTRHVTTMVHRIGRAECFGCHLDFVTEDVCLHIRRHARQRGGYK
jgi:hypothetical protein